MEDRCVMCGDIIPEGRHICSTCDNKIITANKRVFICSPYKGKIEENVKKAREFCRYAWQLGKAPIAPHLYFPQFLNDNSEEERQMGLEVSKELLLKCSELWVFGDCISDGMKQEIELAKLYNIPIKKITIFGERNNK